MILIVRVLRIFIHHYLPMVDSALEFQRERAKFGTIIRYLRLRSGLSQEELGDKCGLDRTYIGGIERGERNPSLKNIVRLANALTVPICDLFSSLEND